MLWLWLLACNSNDVRTPDLGDDTDLDSGETGLDSDLPQDISQFPPPPLDATAIDDIVNQVDDLLFGTTHGVLILAAEHGQVIYESQPDASLKPASNTKLFTTAAASLILGEDYRYSVVGYVEDPPVAGHLEQLTLWIDHDPTWDDAVSLSSSFVADRIAEAAYDAGVREIDQLELTGEAMVDGSSIGTYDPGTHLERARSLLHEAMEMRGISVGSSETTDSLPSEMQALFQHDSATWEVSQHAINTYSHNEMADLELRHLGWTFRDESSFSAGAEVVYEALEDLGLSTEELHFEDGSGLSHNNRVTARAVCALLLAMLDTPEGLAWERSFSISGVWGTLANRLSESGTYGRVHAKTGTLHDTITLSGILYHPTDGHRYVFSILQNDVDDSDEARAIADDLVRVLAADHRGGPGRPNPPELSFVRSQAGGLEVVWEPSAGATSYGVWISTDGKLWQNADAVQTTANSFSLELPANEQRYARIRAFNASGWSESSDVYGASTEGGSRILLVDGNSRWDVQWENSLGSGHDFAARLLGAMNGRAVDTASADAVADGTFALDDYEMVIWALGEESSVDYAFNDVERDLVADWLASGGHLIVSGAEAAWDLDDQGNDETRAFCREWLHASYAGDDAGTWTAHAGNAGIWSGLPEIGFYSPTGMVIDFPDQLSPTEGAQAELSYVGGLEGTAAVSYSGEHRVLTFGFPLESIDGADRLEQVLDRAIDYLEAP